jgi:hypothetical protein
MKDLSKPINFSPVGIYCDMPHCYNSHSLLGLGCIPSIVGNYSLERDRIDQRDGSHWLTKEMFDFLSKGLLSENREYTEDEIRYVSKRNKKRVMFINFKGKIKKIAKKILLRKDIRG